MPDLTTSDFSSPAGPLVLRLQEADDAGDVRTKLVRITARRCAIGSDSTCNLQIRAAGARPLDCLIVRGREHTVVRRWTPETLLAGQEPCDAVLVPGDRFEVGRAEFEVLEPDALAGEQPDDRVVEIADEPAASLREVALQNWQSTARLRQGCELNRHRVRRLVERLRACRTELAELKQSPTEETSSWERHSETPVETDLAEDRAHQSICEEEEAAGEDLRFETISADAPVTASALLGRLGVTLPEDDQDEDRLAPMSAMKAEPALFERPAFSGPERPQREERQPTANPDDRDEEESVENYMSRLLERVRQKADAPQTSYQHLPIARAGEQVQPEGEAADDDKPAPLTELPARRGRHSNEAVDLSAMRELAHMHAQSVLDTHSRRRFQRSSIGQIGVVAGSLVLGVVLACLSGGWPLAIYPAMLSFAVAIVWGAQYALSMRQIAAMRDEQATGDSPFAAPAPVAAMVVDDLVASDRQRPV